MPGSKGRAARRGVRWAHEKAVKEGRAIPGDPYSPAHAKECPKCSGKGKGSSKK